jgi:hypothetical protein
VDKPRIQDIPSFKKMLEDIKTFEQIQHVYHIFKPSLERAGYDLSQVDMALHEFESAARNVSNLPVKFDRFNDMLTQKGWIAYDTLRTDVIEAAVEHAENGKLDEAEQILVDHFDEKLIRTQLATMIGIKAFRPRMALAQKALVDYSDGRYYACVLVVLSLLDGLVHDLGQLGFFTLRQTLRHGTRLRAIVAAFLSCRKSSAKLATAQIRSQSLLPFATGSYMVLMSTMTIRL